LRSYVRPVVAFHFERWPSWFPQPEFQTSLQFIEDFAVALADFSPSGDTKDLDGVYGGWFDRLGADVVLVRPDFYVFGTSSFEDVNALVQAAQCAMGPIAVDRGVPLMAHVG
jgi:hypothetical protein